LEWHLTLQTQLADDSPVALSECPHPACQCNDFGLREFALLIQINYFEKGAAPTSVQNKIAHRTHGFEIIEVIVSRIPVYMMYDLPLFGLKSTVATGKIVPYQDLLPKFPPRSWVFLVPNNVHSVIVFNYYVKIPHAPLIPVSK